MLKNVTDLTNTDFSKGLNTNSNVLSLEKNQSPNIMNVVLNPDLSIEKRLGTMTQNATIIATSSVLGFSPDSNNTLTTKLQAFWKLDEASGTRADSISTHHLTDANNNIGQAVGILRYSALYSSASTQALFIGNTSTLATGDVDFTISAWFYLNSTSTTAERSIVTKRDAGSTPNVSLLLHCDGADGSTTFTDNSPSPKTVTAVGDAQVDASQFKFGGASLLCDGASDYLNIPSATDFNFGTGDFTIDFWVRFNGAPSTCRLIDSGASDANEFFILFAAGGPNFEYSMGDVGGSFTWNPSADTWYHVALVRSGTTATAFIDGASIGMAANSSNIDTITGLVIGANSSGTQGFTGWIDEVRVSNVAQWTSNFAVPTTAYSDASTASQYEYALFVNTDNIVTFRVSSSGTTHNGQVRATSFGSVTTSTWYNVVAWHDTGDRLGISVNLSATTASYASGLRAGSAPFTIGAISNGGSAVMDGRIDEVGFWKTVLTAQHRKDLYNLGTGNSYSISFSGEPWGAFDFGASNLRWVVAAAGTGVYASSNLGITWVEIATDRTATYQSFERSKNVLVATSDAYDKPLQWAGSAGTFATILNVSAPLAKFSVNFQGFLILLNTNTRKRGFYYEDENTQLTGDWGDSFDLPSSGDDEITGAFVLRKNLYVSTRYNLFRLTYVGGNPDWSFRELKDWGYVPRTAQIVSLKDVGEVMKCLDWGRKLRFFDGSDDKIVGAEVENDNNLCDFALNKISYALSGLTVSHSVIDSNENIYKLCVAIGANTTTTTHTLNFDGRTLSYYPFSNTPFNVYVMAESANRRYLLALDRSGYCHIVNTGNLDAGRTRIDDVFDSPFIYEKSPSNVSKSNKIDFYFSPASAGNIYFQDRVDFDTTFMTREVFPLTNNEGKVLHKESIDIPQTANVYQYRLTSSSGSADPWKLNRTDYFLKGLGIGDNE